MQGDFGRYEQEIRDGLEADRLKDKADNLNSLFRPLSDFEEEDATWLIPGWVPDGQITLIAADGGVGKTSLWVDIAAAISSGRSCILDSTKHKREPGTVLFCTTEDSVRKKLRRKLREAGAGLDRIKAMDLTGDKTGLLRSFKFGTPELYEVIRNVKPKLCIFDPVQGFIPPDVNMGSRNAMRDCMAPLLTIGEDVGTTFLVICHTNKRKAAFGRDRIADSADLWDISRSVLMCGYTEEQGIRYVSQEKNNYDKLQDTILFSISEKGQVQNEGTSHKRDREYQSEAAIAKSPSKREECREYIIQTLNDMGPSLETRELDYLLGIAGFSAETIKRSKADLKKDGSIRYFSSGSGRDGSKVWHVDLVNPF